MPIRLSFSYVSTFLLFVMLEFHETVHIVVGRLLCGCWGSRDFNVWSLYAGRADRHPHWWLATLSGPSASFALRWLGLFWLGSANSSKVAVGFPLIFANILFGNYTDNIITIYKGKKPAG